MNKKQARILLDSNVWRYLVDADAVDPLARMADRRQVRILSAPSVLYEALRTANTALRDKLSHAMARVGWTKLMPEAFEEAEEFISEVRRLRPEWLITNPDLRWRHINMRDWTDSRGRHHLPPFWSRVRKDPAMVARHVRQCEGTLVARARTEAELSSKLAKEAGWTFGKIRLRELTAMPMQSLPGWSRDEVEYWRLESLYTAASCFGHPPFSEWISPFVRLDDDLVRNASWNRFWLYETDAEHMPRWWMRTACNALLRLRRITDGTPCDSQLATYLFSATLFITADKALGDVLTTCRESAPRPVARIAVVPGGAEGVLKVFEEVDSCSRAKKQIAP